MTRLFCFGLGYSALALARDLMAAGWTVAGTTRSEEKHQALETEGIEAFLFGPDLPLRDPGAALAGTTHLLTSIAPDDEGDPVLRAHLKDLLACEAMTWAGYLGTTGVYGDRDGA
ncbi:MAG: SDR family NAD(P)-dependent oxidoreductase, partial [Rhizobiales bacterium]|nr:SDR family NAD(P)-dependent oxidoreductase [Hyphomicrobiales bacterium]